MTKISLKTFVIEIKMGLFPCYSNVKIEAGCDEAGRGCLAGPVVAAAVILAKDFDHPLLNDSKVLSREERKSISQEIKSQAIDFAIAEVDNNKIDQINILQASILAMHLAIEKLSPLPELLLIDGNRFQPYPLIPHICIVKGDAQYFSIAAASVLAKTYRDQRMQEMTQAFPQYGWETNAGYPTAFHRQAILDHGETPLHRKSFKLYK